MKLVAQKFFNAQRARARASVTNDCSDEYAPFLVERPTQLKETYATQATIVTHRPPGECPACDRGRPPAQLLYHSITPSRRVMQPTHWLNLLKRDIDA